MIVNPGIRRFLGSAISRLFNSASFYAPLTHSAVPVRAATGTTGTFTRATTSTWKNNDGYLVTGVAGEIGFVGARRVRNLISTSSEDIPNYANNNTTVSASSEVISGVTSVYDIYEAATTGIHTRNRLFPALAGHKYVCSVRAKAGTLRRVMIRDGAVTGAASTFDLVDGVVVADEAGGVGSIESTEDAGVYLLSMTFTAPADGNYSPYIYLMRDGTAGNGSASYAGNVTKFLTVGGVQVEDVTAQTTQTAGEYVSVGVESAPYYHGSFVDGVKCFPTDLSGNPIPAATMLGYSAEGARTNLTIWNRDLTNAAWTRRSGTVTTALTAVGADGAANSATAVRNLGATGVDDLYQTASYAVTAGVRVEPSLSLRAVSTSGTLRFANAYDVGASGAWNIDLSLVSTTRMERITRNHPSVTITSEWVGGSLNFVQPIFDTTTGPLNFDVDLIQVEVGTFSSTGIATTTAAVTRNADVLTYSSAGNIDGTKGWCYAEVAANWSASPTDPKAIAAFQSSIDYGLWYLTSANNLTLTDGAAAAGAEKSFTILPTAQKVAATWSSAANSSLGAAQGVAGGADTFGTAFAPDQIGVGIYRNGTVSGEVHWFGTIRNVRIGQRQLSASELQAVTA